MADNAAPVVLMGGRKPGQFWPTFDEVVVPNYPPPLEEDDEDDADEDPVAPVLRRPATRVPAKRPAASPSSQLRRPARADSVLESVVPAESPVIPQKIPQKRKACSDAVSQEPGKRTYGCSRCLMRTGGCDTCRKEGFKPRGPRKGGKEKALPAAPEP